MSESCVQKEQREKETGRWDSREKSGREAEVKGEKKGIQNWGKRQFEKLKGGKESRKSQGGQKEGKVGMNSGKERENKGD